MAETLEQIATRIERLATTGASIIRLERKISPWLQLWAVVSILIFALKSAGLIEPVPWMMVACVCLGQSLLTIACVIVVHRRVSIFQQLQEARRKHDEQFA